MKKTEIILVIWQLYLFSSSNSSRVKCEWQTEYVCGDECAQVTSNCFCGNETILFEDSGTYSCCNSLPCERIETNIICKDGIKQEWDKLCNTHCIQMAQYGFSTLPCDWSDTECYMAVNACQGTNECDRYDVL